MSHTELISRLRDVIEVALSDSSAAGSEFDCSQANRDDTARSQREAEAVRDEVIAALDWLSAILEQLGTVTRITVATDSGRVFEQYDAYKNGVELYIQDDTLKVLPASEETS